MALMSQADQNYGTLSNSVRNELPKSPRDTSPFVKILRSNRDVVLCFLKMVLPNLEIGDSLHKFQQTTIKNTLPTLLALSQICREWRRHVQEESCLWNQLVLTSSGHLDAFNYCIRHSGNTPLHVKIHFYPDPLLEDVKDQLHRISSRIRTLFLSASYSSLQELDLKLPNAIDIFLHAGDQAYTHNTDSRILEASYPHRLKVHGVPSTMCKTSYIHIVSIEFGGIRMPDLCALLDSAAGLRKLVATLLRSDRPKRQITHEILEEFVLNRGEVRNGRGILGIVIFPNLQHLTLSQNDKDAPNFIRRSGCRLVSFGLQREDELALTPVIDHTSINDLYLHQMGLNRIISLLERCLVKYEYASFFRHLRRILIHVSQVSIPDPGPENSAYDHLHYLVRLLQLSLPKTSPPIVVEIFIEPKQPINSYAYHGDIDEEPEPIVMINGVNAINLYNIL